MRPAVLLSLVFLVGCGWIPAVFDQSAALPGPPAKAADPAAPTPDATPDAAASADQPAATPRPGGRLGTTIAALGDPGRSGAWMETPLVRVQRPGRVRYASTSVPVTLIPAGGPATGGSRLSLAAMRALGLALTDLTEVEVFAGG